MPYAPLELRDVDRLGTLGPFLLLITDPASLGQRAEARRIFSRLGREFEAQRNAFDAALVTLDQAVLEFEDGRVEQAKTLSEKLVWVLDSQRLSREALAALQVYLSAVRAGTAEIELARRVLRFVERSRHDPALRFGHRVGG